ncbi:MAG: imidazole glycerol phosphate synthase subunit HisH [Acutalibacteraceae bacterium]|nr:imidazole glycerol phosphate synthase subunit HisH [Acutalibacteraceae bacterium]
MIAIIDYGVGNLFSLCSSFKAIGADICVTGEKEIIKKADKLILPGVGAFEDAAKKLRLLGLDEVIKEEVSKGKSIMGICLGMQMLFEKSYEYGEHKGLGLLKGEVIGMENTIPKNLKIPHIGWNALHFTKDNPLFKYINDGDCVYFVHSFYASNCEDSLIATAEYGKELTAAVAKDNVFGCQFHPEKSGEVGLKILKAFCEFGDNL